MNLFILLCSFYIVGFNLFSSLVRQFERTYNICNSITIHNITEVISFIE